MLSWTPPVALLPAFTKHADESPLPNALGRGFRGGGSLNQEVGADSTRGFRGGVDNGKKVKKSRGIFYVAPDGTAAKALPVTSCPEPLEQIRGSELAPACNLREWLWWKIRGMSTNDYIIVPHINTIVARISVTKHSTGTRAYCIMHNGNITPIVGQSHNECLVQVFTWLGCVCAGENTIEKSHAAFIFQHWCSEFGTSTTVKRREAFLTDMLAHEDEPICLQRPGLFSDMPLWELLIPQLKYGQFTVINELCAILARPSRDTYWLLYNNNVLEYVREMDDDGQYEQTSDELREELVEKIRLLIRLQTI